MFVCTFRHCQVENVLPKTSEIPKGRRFQDCGILGSLGGLGGGGCHTLWNFRRQGSGLKHGCCPWLGMDVYILLTKRQGHTGRILAEGLDGSEVCTKETEG